jgi:hypothetical protein
MGVRRGSAATGQEIPNVSQYVCSNVLLKCFLCLANLLMLPHLASLRCSTKLWDPVGRTPVSYSISPGFKPQPENRLYRLVLFVIFSISSQLIRRWHS